MAIMPRSLDMTDKDFDSLRTRMFALIASVFPTWTDDMVADFGNILVELYAHVGDALFFYQDNQAGESRITTARLRRSILGLVKLVGYIPRGASASSTDEVFALAAAMLGRVVIPAGTRILTPEVTEPIAYQLLSDVVFEPGEVSKMSAVEHSETVSESVASSGLPNQRVELVRVPYLDGSAVISATNGDYIEVGNFLASRSTDRHYVVTVDQNDRARVTFGNGINGAIPAKGTIAITYKIGGGSSGRVEAGALSRLERSFFDSTGTIASVSCTNPNASSGGYDRESNSEIAIYAPASVRVLGRAVAREDYEIAALTVPGVARALHLTSNEYGIGENQGAIFVVPAGGGVPSAALLATVAALFEIGGAYPKTNAYDLGVYGASYFDIDVTATVYRRAGTTTAAARAAIVAALTGFFALTVTNDAGETVPNPLIDFGFNMKDSDGNPTNALSWSDVFNAIRDAAGIRKVDSGPSGLLLNGERQDATIGVAAFPRLGTVRLIDGDSGAEF